MADRISVINPKELAPPRGYSHAVAVKGNHTTIYIGGKNSVARDGSIIGKGDLKAQTRKALENVQAVLDAADADRSSVVKFTVYLVQGQDPRVGALAFLEKWGDSPRLPAVTVVFVAGLGHPDWLVEIEAVAVVPE